MTASNVDKQWQADLIEMVPYAKLNQGNKYILTAVDVVSRYAFTRPLTDKTSKSVARALEDIFRKSKRKPEELFTDKGKEFSGPEMKKLLKRRKVHHIQSFSKQKAALCERFNRTLKTILYKSFTYTGEKKWVDALPLLTESYNQRFHTVIQESPATLNTRNQAAVFVQPVFTRLQQPKFRVGQLVRKSLKKLIFSKGYEQTFSTELFRVHRIIPGEVLSYKLEDSEGRVVDGRFYEQDLVATKK